MTVQLTIRNVPTGVRDEIAARAARQGKSMQEFLRQELERIASQPSLDEVCERIRQRKAMTGTKLSVDEVLAAQETDRR